MSADVVCMSLANVPPGEQRSRFLAVGLVDNTVRIISLDPSVRQKRCVCVLYVDTPPKLIVSTDVIVKQTSPEQLC